MLQQKKTPKRVPFFLELSICARLIPSWDDFIPEILNDDNFEMLRIDTRGNTQHSAPALIKYIAKINHSIFYFQLIFDISHVKW